ncbi:unnamed protein product [Arctogadus glacialis]
MKAGLTPAKPWGFHLTGHLNLPPRPHAVALQAKRANSAPPLFSTCNPTQPAGGSPAPAPYEPPTLTSLHFTSL